MNDVIELSNVLSQIAENHKLSGLSIGQIDNSNIKYYNFGFSNVINQSLVSENTIFEFASLTKPIVSIIAMKIFQAFKIPLQSKISEIVPEYSIYQNVTLLDILSHSTGFPNWPSDRHKATSHFIPGSRFSYSGFGYNLLENIFIKLSGKNSEQLLKSLICMPLSLNSTSFIYNESKSSQIANGTKYGRPVRKWQPDSPILAASLHSSIHDYSKIIQDIFSQDPIIFNNFTKKQLFNEVQNVNSDFSSETNWPNDTYELFKDVYWGPGWGIEVEEGRKYYWHWGDNDIFQSFFWIDPLRKNAIVMATNCENGNKSWGEITKTILNKDLKSIKWLKTDKEFYRVT